MTPLTLLACAMFLISGCSPQAAEPQGAFGPRRRIQNSEGDPCRGNAWTSTHDGHKLRGWGYVGNSRTPVPPETTHGYCNRDIRLNCNTKVYRCEVREKPESGDAGPTGADGGSSGTGENL